MGKTNKKKNLSEKAAKKGLKDIKKVTNPFEIHVNKDKNKILGKKSKSDRGLPGISRSKAIKKRKNTLLHEYNRKDKDNIFMDKRIGEKKSMTDEEKFMARFAAARMKSHKKQSIYNLNDDEVLTHRGQTLEEIEKFDDPRSDDEFSDDENVRKGHLDKQFVDDAHFGGGVLSKPNAPLSRQDVIEQLILESKKRKAEKQKIREQTIDLTEKLDSEWRDLVPLIKSSKKTEDELKIKPKIDDYDRAVRELKFESRGNPTDRLKSEEEIMKEEKEKLEALERDRITRMKGLINNINGQIKHRSADDLEDGFEVEEIVEEPLAYGEDGKLLENSNKNINQSDHEEVNNSNSDDSEEDDNSDDENEAENDHTEEVNQSTNEEEVEDENNEDDDEDDLSDLKESETSSEDEEGIVHNEHDKKNSVIKILEDKPVNVLTNGVLNVQKLQENDENRVKEIREDLQRRKEIMEKAREELPYTFNAPESYEELKQLLQNQKPDYQSIIVERIIKCNHWTLGQGNREKLCKVFEYLLKYIVDSACTNETEQLVEYFQICDELCPYLFDLAQASATNTATCVQNILKEKYNLFKVQQKKYPGLDTLILFKLVSLIFPTSDFRHPVVTPSLVFMSQILLRCQVKKKTDISKGLFVATLILEYTLMSKRFSPSTINFLRGIIYLATVKPLMLPKIVPPFKRSGQYSSLLILDKDQRNLKIDVNDIRMIASDLIEGDITDNFRIRAFVTALNLTNEFRDQLKELEAVYSIFEPIVKLLDINSVENYPENIRVHVNKIHEDLKKLADKKLKYLVREKKGPKALRLYEPKIEKVFDGKRHKSMSKEKAEREKLLHKLKKEKKGAIREIRRDASFLAKVQIKNQIKNDEERKRKVKEIYGDASMQQGELNKLKRMK
ncbi:nucleolar protein 14 homolog [Chelonus insularis]|uniref:nucleolar protein 14 homolog n=1 Tax=Chelonus insularis TaxID=460826 RepID=UPI00158C8C00|nr:nucleolar protein 14 homolog [Chelonus insularis]